MIGKERIPALDGIRGLAVVVVVLFHAWPDSVPGGWIGVSLFFTLSGYLITAIIVGDHLPRATSLPDFWRRRARRLLPAATLTLVAVVAGTAIVEVESLDSVVGDALAALAYVHNWRAASAPGGYDAIFDTTLQPLAHMWSLSIEEQVYLLWPALLLLLGVRRAALFGGATVVAGTVWWWGSADAYYATPVRFGEVLVGALVAIWISTGKALSVPRGLALGCAAVLVWLTVTLEQSADFVSRGALVTIATCSTVLVAFVVQGHRISGLELSPLVWLGTRSYAIYLFHWPLLILLDVPPAAAIGASLLLAEASYRLVEHPIRSGRVIQHPLRTLGAASALVGVVGLAVMWVAPRPASDAVVAAAAAAAIEEAVQVVSLQATAATAPAVVSTTTTPSGAAVDLPTAAVSASSTTTTTIQPVDTRIPLSPAPTVMVIGDSTGAAFEPALQGWVEQMGGELVPKSVGTCSPLFSVGMQDVWSSALTGPLDTPCREIPAPGTDLVIVVDHGVVLFDHYDHTLQRWTSIADRETRDAVELAYQRLLDQAAAVGARVAFFTPPDPWFKPVDPPWPLDAGFVGAGGTEHLRLAIYLELVEGLAAANDHVDLVNVGPAIDANPQRYSRTDGLHLDRASGAVNVVVDLVAPAFRIEAEA